MSLFENERYSVCIVHADYSGEKTFYKYFRVADYIPQENPHELAPAFVQKRASSLEETPANPPWLFNPSAARNHESRESDFYIFRWRQNPDEPERPLTKSFYDDANLSDFKEAREVIILKNKTGEQGLREALSEGIPFEGKTTSVFYIVYGNENDLYSAVRCERRDFSFSDGKIQLRYAISNTKETVLSAPRVWLKGYNIIESPHALTSYRKIYAELEEPESDSGVLLRPLDYYASDYVKWFIREESIQVSRSDRRAVSQIIDAAFSHPDALKTYLEADVQEEEIRRFREAIARIVMDEDDPNRELFRNALLENENFYRECIEQVAKSSDSLLEERKRELAEAKSNVERAQSSLTSLNSDIEILNQRKQALESDIESLSSNLEDARKKQDEVFEEIQSNIALKLGLKTVAAWPSTISAPEITAKEGSPYDYTESSLSFEETLLNNIKRLGITSVVGNPADERAAFVTGLMGSLAATKFLAIPQTIARQIADSICVAVSGHNAKRVFVPADYRNATAVLDAVFKENDVVVVDGVIDAVNEGILFSLLSEDAKPIVILPFMSHASASLVAKEAWGKIFLPNVGSLLVCPHSSKDVKLQHAASGPTIPKVRTENALEEACDLNRELERLNLASESLFLTAMVFCAIEDLTDENNIEQYIAQHLLMCSRCDNQSFMTIAEWSEEDRGLFELAKKLDIYGSQH